MEGDPGTPVRGSALVEQHGEELRGDDVAPGAGAPGAPARQQRQPGQGQRGEPPGPQEVKVGEQLHGAHPRADRERDTPVPAPGPYRTHSASSSAPATASGQ